MPLYEYRCSPCNRPFEAYARTFSEQAACPTCGGSEVTRLLSTFAVSSGSGEQKGARDNSFAGCGEGPPCGAAQCGRLPN